MKRPQFEGAKLLLVQPETPDGEARGTTLLAIDSVGAGVSERVLVVLEGRAAGEALGRKWRRSMRRSSASWTTSTCRKTDAGIRSDRRRDAPAGARRNCPAPGRRQPFAAPAGEPAARRATRPIAFARYPIARPVEDVMCLIEPAVRCNHCGYCECHGH